MIFKTILNPLLADSLVQHDFRILIAIIIARSSIVINEGVEYAANREVEATLALDSARSQTVCPRIRVNRAHGKLCYDDS